MKKYSYTIVLDSEEWPRYLADQMCMSGFFASHLVSVTDNQRDDHWYGDHGKSQSATYQVQEENTAMPEQTQPQPKKPVANPCAKARKCNEPYEVWAMNGWVFQVLKKYQSPAKEEKNPYAIWLCACKSPYETDRAGHDTYVADVKGATVLVWQEGNDNLNGKETTLPERYKF